MRLLLATLALASLALSGCVDGEFSNGPDGQSAATTGTLSYNGASTGTHSSQPMECDGSAKVRVSYNMGSGDISVKVTDGAGATAWSKDYSGTGQKSDTQSISGAAGAWTVTVTRGDGGSLYGGGFSGQYNVNLDC